MADLDKQETSAQSKGSSALSRGVTTAAAALALAAGGNSNAQAAQIIEQMGKNLKNKMEKFAATQAQTNDSTANFSEEAAKMGMQVQDVEESPNPAPEVENQAESASPTDNPYQFTQDSTSIATPFKNGKTKNNTTVEVSRTVDARDDKAPIVSTTVQTREQELNRRGRTTETQNTTTSTIEKFNSLSGNSTYEASFSNSNEFDNKGRLRASESSRSEEKTSEAGALKLSHGYEAEHSYGNSHNQRAEYDTKGRTTETQTHFERFGTTSNITDTEMTARRGDNLDNLTQDSSQGIKTYVEAEANKDRHNTGSAEVKADKFQKDGDLKKSLWGRFVEGVGEVYGKIKVGNKKTKAVEVIAEGDEVTATKMVTKKDGSKETSTLSNRAAMRHLNNLRRGVNKKLEQVTGAENLAEYIDRVPDVDKNKQAPLGLAFEAHDKEKLDAERQDLNSDNAQKISEQKQVSATDVMKKLIQDRLSQDK